MLFIPRERRGIASIVGTLVFLLVFILALGAQAYTSALEAQAASAEEEAQQIASRHGQELLIFGVGASGLTATNEGPTSASINHLILRYPNGTVYSLMATALVSTGGVVAVQSLVPSGVCTPGTATCLSKYNQIVSGNPLGSEVGLLTSMGNSFWYAYSSNLVPWSSLTGFPPSCSTGQFINKLGVTPTCAPAGGVTMWVTADVATGSGGYVSTTLTVSLPANGRYVFYAFTAMQGSLGGENYNFELHPLRAGATLVIVCSPMSYPLSGGANQPANCLTSAGTNIAATPFTIGLTSTMATPGLFGMVTLGSSGGTLQIDFACVANCGSVIIKAGSFMVVQQVG
jgi:hypothetical protein